ncbi:MAG: hypothetical protein AAFR64_14420, partial [Pseudomonadota bacterium]
MRVKVPLLAYAAAALAGSAFFISSAILINQEPFSPEDLIYILPTLVIVGGVLAAPVAAPTIIISERRKSGPSWVFLAAGLVAGFAMLGVFVYMSGWPRNSMGFILPATPPANRSSRQRLSWL